MSDAPLPDGWVEAKLMDIAAISMGQSPPGSATNADGTGIPLVGGAANLKQGRVVIDRYTSAPTKVSQPGDIIVCIRATIGRTAISDGKYCLGRGVAGFTPCEVHGDWLRRFIDRSSDALQDLEPFVKSRSPGQSGPVVP